MDFTYTTFNAGLPRWAGPVLPSLSERWGAQPGWDTYGSSRPTSAVFKNAELSVNIESLMNE
jgi:hypothetical protein